MVLVCLCSCTSKFAHACKLVCVVSEIHSTILIFLAISDVFLRWSLFVCQVPLKFKTKQKKRCFGYRYDDIFREGEKYILLETRIYSSITSWKYFFFFFWWFILYSSCIGPIKSSLECLRPAPGEKRGRVLRDLRSKLVNVNFDTFSTQRHTK